MKYLPKHRGLFESCLGLNYKAQIIYLGPEDGNNRIIILATEEDLDYLANSSHWFADGTFDHVPLFDNMYSIHGDVHESIEALIFALMPNRSEFEYVRFLKKLKELKPELASWAGTLMHDCEMAALNAFEEEFPECEIS